MIDMSDVNTFMWSLLATLTQGEWIIKTTKPDPLQPPGLQL